ncbi:MAG: hypothetical protein WCA46_15935 [Actinocatenispora sp.]
MPGQAGRTQVPPPRREETKFNGFVSSGTPAPVDRTASAGGYRSLREMSAAPSAAQKPTGAADGSVPPVLRHLGGDTAAPPARRWTARRFTVLGIVAVVLVAVLGVGGYAGYQVLAPYYGLGYHTGGSATVDSVRLTVTEVRCGLDTAPFGNVGTPQGGYCAVVVTAENHGQNTAFVNLRDWQADLDVGLAVRPVGDWLPYRNEAVLGGQRAVFRLGFDIPDGARLSTVHMAIGDKEGTVTVS